MRCVKTQHYVCACACAYCACVASESQDQCASYGEFSLQPVHVQFGFLSELMKSRQQHIFLFIVFVMKFVYMYFRVQTSSTVSMCEIFLRWNVFVRLCPFRVETILPRKKSYKKMTNLITSG